MILYDTLRSGNAWKVRLLASLLDIPLERRTLSIDRGDLKQPAFQAIAPLGQVPVLELPDGSHLAESMSILFYLAQGTTWWPADCQTQARVLSWMSFEQEHHMKPLAQLRLHLALHRDRDPMSEEFTRHAEQAKRALELMERQLDRQSAHGWIATSNAPSIADVALYPYTCMAPMGGIALESSPSVRAWLRRIEALPGYQALFPAEPERNHSTQERP
ncbi:glutathione S-transferase family protein [Variovorax paradoxus]|uniref:glutathione S-transferase family protein n=1 Tax=Variovorax paradoxus TaxID=34073 RepID=UPI002788F34D|nr:glutathione S-transferase family protein [Variovorax paradoxus]MDQ0589959.1 glutathione S-transferase [Variovorax paradoxus]